MKTGIFMISLMIGALLIPHGFGLLIDPFITYIELSQVIAPENPFVFTIEAKYLERPLGFRLHYQNDDDVLKVKIRDPDGNLVMTSTTYGINEYQSSIHAEFTPEHEGTYQVEVINTGQSNVSLSGYHGEMLTWKEIDDIQKEHGYSEEPYDLAPTVLLVALVGGSIGLAVGYFVFGRKRK